MIKNLLLRPIMAGFLVSLSLLGAIPEAHAFFAVDIRTTTTMQADTLADRLFTNAPAAEAAAGTRIWFVLDVNGDGVPQDPVAGAILGPDDRLMVEDVVPGAQPVFITGRFVRTVTIDDDTLRDKTNVFVYLWEYYGSTNTVPHYEPPAGARYGRAKLYAEPPPEFGNGKWRVHTDVFANSLTVGGGGNEPPVISTQPQDATVNEGGSVTFTVSATGTPPLTYQWRFGGTDIAGATNSTLTLTNVTPAQAGTYDVRITNAFGNVLSAAATLTVNASQPPIITAPPQNATGREGGSVTFTVTATGTPPLSYQWRHNTTDIPGATNNTLTLTNLTSAQAGTYDVRVTNSAGNVLSPGATLTVNPIARPTLGTISAQTSGSDLILSFSLTTETGVSYQLQSSPTLSASPIPWTDEATPVTGDGAPKTLSSTNNMSTAPMKFYRIIAN